MSKERARLRAERLAVADRERLRRQARQRRRQRRRELARRLTPRRPGGRTGRMFARRSRGQRAGIAGLTMACLLLVWFLVEPLALRIALTLLLLLALPAVVVIVLGRRI